MFVLLTAYSLQHLCWCVWADFGAVSYWQKQEGTKALRILSPPLFCWSHPYTSPCTSLSACPSHPEKGVHTLFQLLMSLVNCARVHVHTHTDRIFKPGLFKELAEVVQFGQTKIYVNPHAIKSSWGVCVYSAPTHLFQLIRALTRSWTLTHAFH